MSEEPSLRVRLRYSVRGKVRFLSHRDVARVTERAIRRAGIPIAYTQGFSPRPKLQYGLALSTGYESDAEFFDLFLDPLRVGVREPQAVGAALDSCLPKGLAITAAAAVAPGEPSLQDCVASTSWIVRVAAATMDPGELARRVDTLWAAETHPLEIVRKGKQVREDLRPLLFHLSVAPPAPIDDAPELHVELGTKPRSIRPAELLETLGVDEPLLVRRTHQWKQHGERDEEPLGLEAPPSRAEVRAS
jgi:radical SAM-linked protein